VIDLAEGPSLQGHLQSVDKAAFPAISDQLCDLIAAVHRVEPTALPERLARPASYEDYLSGLIAKWAATERAHIEANPFMRYVGAWLDANRPPPVELALCHGDFQSPNVMVGP